ncbi:MAG: hypothetical protein JO250_06545, partial [Armatimonadetes bacterium]|nr:hypothetical protein [Armatimonadota bacterium]
MRRHLGSTALSALLALTPVPGAAQVASDPADAFSLVARAIEARHSLRYVARQDIVLVPPADSAGAPPSSLTQIVTDVTRDGRRVRLVYWLPCDATHRVVVDDGRLFRQWEPARRTILVDQSHEETAAAGRRMLALLHRNYRCLLLRRQRVNSLPCDLVAVRPRRGPAPSRLLWIERGRYAILRTEEYDGGGRRRYFSFYEAFRFVARVPARAFSLPQAGRIRPISHPVRDVAEPGAAFAAAGVAGRLPAWLPPGYVLVGCAVSGRRNKAALLRYGDGLKTVSVFEEAGRDAEDPLSRQETLRRELAR